MWLGMSTHTLDAKSRVFLPKRFQEGLDRDGEGNLTVIITRGFEDCLFLFSESGFQRALERLKTQAFEGEQERLMQRLFFSYIHPTQLDNAGRLLLPEALRKVAGIQSKEVVLLGLMDRIELWSKERWDEFHARHDGEFNRLDQVLLSPRAGRPAGT
jgi:transcriptional regulator MraZ